ncbi:MAG: flagellar basal body rod protein FlgC [Betaproteobacteria bacterium]|jgi:flagellar basal-body rod protein FlgC|nr:flagellar basal body rod protein FlgC [Betaproteobacteria bacterium]
MSLFKAFEIAASGVTAQSQRLNATASNLANAESAATPGGKAYQARQVLFQTTRLDARDPRSEGVKVKSVIEDTSTPRRVHDPKHPLADETGYVTMPNVNVAEEMVNMLSASRSYQSNLEVMNTSRNLLLKTLTLGS